MGDTSTCSAFVGPDPVADREIGVGDMINGKVIDKIFVAEHSWFNDDRDMVFMVRFEDLSLAIHRADAPGGDPTPEVQIAELGNAVDGLIGGPINNGQGNALNAKLNAALASIAAGETDDAINQLGAFIKQVNAFLRSGQVSLKDGQALVSQAQAIIDSLVV